MTNSPEQRALEVAYLSRSTGEPVEPFKRPGRLAMDDDAGDGGWKKGGGVRRPETIERKPTKPIPTPLPQRVSDYGAVAVDATISV